MARFGSEKSDSPAVRAHDVHTLLGKGSAFTGTLVFEGQVRIDGRFEGQISTEGTLVIGEGAEVLGEVHAGTVVVSGRVDGYIRASQLLQLHAPAHVRGTLDAVDLIIERGVRFEGSCTMAGERAPANRGA